MAKYLIICGLLSSSNAVDMNSLPLPPFFPAHPHTEIKKENGKRKYTYFQVTRMSRMFFTFLKMRQR